jgi:catechol 2,3-dioxygenase-like lactoylglutathione lyase family enzyme
MLAEARVATRLPCQDLERARRWYAEKLGLEPAEEREGGLLYSLSDGAFALFASSGAPSGTHTQMGFEVDDMFPPAGPRLPAVRAERGAQLVRLHGRRRVSGRRRRG